MFIPFSKEGATLLFDTYVPSDHELETCSNIFLTDGEVEWYPENVTMDRNITYGDEACLAEMSRKKRKDVPTDVFHKSDLILGLVTDSLLLDIALEWLVSAINMKEE